jgi:hypothetical protein
MERIEQAKEDWKSGRFAPVGIWTRWTSVRKVKEGETTNDIFAFLTTEPNQEVGVRRLKGLGPRPSDAALPRQGSCTPS